MKFNIITLFPESFSALDHSIIKRAKEKNLINLNLVDLRDFGIGKHKQVDDTPYGGGPGMVIRIDVVDRALRSLKLRPQSSPTKMSESDTKSRRTALRTILLTPQGKRYTQADARRLSKYDELTLICGHYEGFDERIRRLADEQISIGDYVLTGGELPSMVLIDSITRLLPKVLGNKESAKYESFSSQLPIANCQSLNLEYPQYTRPENFTLRLAQGAKITKVPKILLSGNHAEIKNWREEQSKKKSKSN